eukprot:c11313_g1_i3 orf=696-1598(-)
MKQILGFQDDIHTMYNFCFAGFSGAIPGNTKPCLKFFSTCGCPYGEGCHFSHYVPGGISALATSGLGPGKSGLSSLATLSAPTLDASVNLGGYKTRVCNQFGTPDGCRFGNKCHFAHGGRELRKTDGSGGGAQATNSGHFSSNLAAAPLSSETSRGFLAVKDFTSTNSVAAGAGLPREPSPPGITTSLGASSAAKASIVTGGVHGKELTHLTGARLAVRDYEKDPNVRNFEFEGTFKSANQVVRDLLMHKDPLPPKSAGFSSHKYKTKMCENFARGTCTFGERCHFAHGDAELRKPSFPA